MSDNTGIEWAAASWNPIVGCSKVSAGCANCYAERMTHRLAHNPATPQYHGLTDAEGHWMGETRLVESALDQPTKWKKPRTIFVCSMSDLFHERNHPATIIRVLRACGATPQHRYLFLTKRPHYMLSMVTPLSPHANWWLGTSIEDNSDACLDRASALAALAARDWNTWWSCEPLLGQIATAYLPKWVVVGGETGPNARPQTELRRLVPTLQALGVPVLVKQPGRRLRYEDMSPELRVREYPW